jgi:hypothetical protein
VVNIKAHFTPVNREASVCVFVCLCMENRHYRLIKAKRKLSRNKQYCLHHYTSFSQTVNVLCNKITIYSVVLLLVYTHEIVVEKQQRSNMNMQMEFICYVEAICGGGNEMSTRFMPFLKIALNLTGSGEFEMCVVIKFKFYKIR